MGWQAGPSSEPTPAAGPSRQSEQRSSGQLPSAQCPSGGHGHRGAHDGEAAGPRRSRRPAGTAQAGWGTVPAAGPDPGRLGDSEVDPLSGHEEPEDADDEAAADGPAGTARTGCLPCARADRPPAGIRATGAKGGGRAEPERTASRVDCRRARSRVDRDERIKDFARCRLRFSEAHKFPLRCLGRVRFRCPLAPLQRKRLPPGKSTTLERERTYGLSRERGRSDPRKGSNDDATPAALQRASAGGVAMNN